MPPRATAGAPPSDPMYIGNLWAMVQMLMGRGIMPAPEAQKEFARITGKPQREFLSFFPSCCRRLFYFERAFTRAIAVPSPSTHVPARASRQITPTRPTKPNQTNKTKRKKKQPTSLPPRATAPTSSSAAWRSSCGTCGRRRRGACTWAWPTCRRTRPPRRWGAGTRTCSGSSLRAW